MPGGDGVTDQGTGVDEVVELRRLVELFGGDVDTARSTGDPFELAALGLDALLTPDNRRYTVEEASELAGVDPSVAQRLWRAMGFPDPPAGERIAGDMDVEALRRATEIMDQVDGIDNGVRQTRIYSAAIARIAELWVDELRKALDAGDSLLTAARTALPTYDVERTTWLLGYVHRRLLAAGFRRELSSRSLGEHAQRSVAFADVVGFTTLTERIGPLELSKLIESFEALAYDTVAVLGGRVVKTIGDEVLYTAEDARTVLDISRTLLQDSEALGLPELRIGVDCGAAVWYEGDLYGPAVNRASRIVSEASPGGIAASRTFADTLPHEPWTDRGAVDLKGIGTVPLVELCRTPAG